ncbi:ribonuclease H-like domain-containing protein [Tanacetum coccineum]
MLVLKPPSVNVIRSMWLFRHKYHADGSLSRYKDQLVANRRTQQVVIDCDDTFSPVVKSITILTVLSLALSCGWHVHQLDVKNAFLNALERAHMISCNFSRTPVDKESKLGPNGDPILDPPLYRSLTSGLQYLTFTHPNISYVVQQICLYMHNPREPHLAALKRILRYVYGDNIPSWSSKGQHTISRSSAKAEYQGVANVVAETAWIRNLLWELHSPLLSVTLVYCDNVRILHASSRYLYANIFTKGLPSALFEEFCTSLSVRSSIASTAGGSSKYKTNNDLNGSAIPHDPGLRINILDYNPNDQDVVRREYVEMEGLRINILDYNPNDQDVVRREYVEMGPCQPRSYNFPQTKFEVKSHRFNPRWFNKYDWFEYSIDKDATFCLVCYLFKNRDDHVEDAFVKNGFKGWNKPVVFDKHVGKFNSVHNQAMEKYDAVNKSKTSIQNIFDYRKKEDKNKYRQHLCATLRCLRYLLNQGLAIRGHDETKESSNRESVAQAFDDNEYESGKGRNQELGLGRSGDTHWGSHYKLITNVISLYSLILDVLEKIEDVSSNSDD